MQLGGRTVQTLSSRGKTFGWHQQKSKQKYLVQLLENMYISALQMPSFAVSTMRLAKKYVPVEHIAQVVQHATVLSTRFCVYVLDSKTSIVYTVVIRLADVHRKAAKTAINIAADPVITCDYRTNPELPEFIPTTL